VTVLVEVVFEWLAPLLRIPKAPGANGDPDYQLSRHEILVASLKSVGYILWSPAS
jgi:hypothetical protein